MSDVKISGACNGAAMPHRPGQKAKAQQVPGAAGNNGGKMSWKGKSK